MGARATQRKLARKTGELRQQTILLPRYSPRNPPSRQVKIVEKICRLAGTNFYQVGGLNGILQFYISKKKMQKRDCS